MLPRECDRFAEDQCCTKEGASKREGIERKPNCGDVTTHGQLSSTTEREDELYYAPSQVTSWSAYWAGDGFQCLGRRGLHCRVGAVDVLRAGTLEAAAGGR